MRKGKPGRKNIFICSDHFTANCFNKDPIKVLRDGLEVDIPRKRVELKKGSVSSIFKVLLIM